MCNDSNNSLNYSRWKKFISCKTSLFFFLLTRMNLYVSFLVYVKCLFTGLAHVFSHPHCYCKIASFSGKIRKHAHFAPTGYPPIKPTSQQISLITTYAVCKSVIGAAIITTIRFHILRKRSLLWELFFIIKLFLADMISAHRLYLLKRTAIL